MKCTRLFSRVVSVAKKKVRSLLVSQARPTMCLKVYSTVRLALLLTAGDVESNPGPETNEGMCSSFFF